MPVNSNTPQKTNLITITESCHVQALAGNIYIVDDKGNRIPLQSGQLLQPGDNIIVVSGNLTLETQDHQIITLMSTDQVAVNTDSLPDERDTQATDPQKEVRQESDQKESDKNSAQQDESIENEHSGIRMPFTCVLTAEEITPGSGADTHEVFSQFFTEGQFGVLGVLTPDLIAYQPPDDRPALSFHGDSHFQHDSFRIPTVLLHPTPTETVTATGPSTPTGPGHTGSAAHSHITLTFAGSGHHVIPPHAAHIAGNDTGQVTEDVQLQTHGTLTISDPNPGENHFMTTTQQGALGTFSLNSQGQWSFTANNTSPTIQSLGTGQSLTTTYTVQSADGTQHQVTIAIHGTNDIPALGQVTSQAVAEGDAALHGHLSATDPDTGDTLTFSSSTPVNGFILKSDGSYTFNPQDHSYNHLAVGQSQVLSIPVSVTDSQGATVSQNLQITVTGTNDGPVMTAVPPQTAAEGDATVHGQLSATDPDTGDTLTYTSSTSVNGFSMKQDGSYSFDPKDGAYNHLAVGQSQVLNIPVSVTDSQGSTVSQNLQITVIGTNDAPTVTGATTLTSGTEDTAVTLHTGDLLQHATDVDTTDTLTVQNLKANHGTIKTNPDGSFTFTPDKDYNGQISLTYDVTDAHGGTTPAQASLNLAATGDAARISGQDTGDVSESKYQNMSPDYAQPHMAKLNQDILFVDGKLDITDPDSGESAFDTKRGGFNYSGQYGHLLMHGDGHWNYVVTAGSTDWVGNRQSSTGTTIDKLGAGQSLKDTITVYAKDGTAHDIVITIHGDNDKPYCSSEVQLAPGREDNQVTITEADLLKNTVDVDNNDQGKLTIDNLRVDHGSVQHNLDGTYTLTPEANYNGQVHFSYDVKDAHSGVTSTGAVMNLAAVGDAATFSGDDSGSLKEDVNIHTGAGTPELLVTGFLNVHDPDVGQDHFQFSQFGEHAVHDPFGGRLQIDRSGVWTYHVDDRNTALQQLGEGQTEVVTYRVSSADGTTHDINITVTGTNDAPTVTGATTLASGTEDTGVTLHASDLLQHATDVDTTDTLSVQSLRADHGTITDNKDGTFNFTPDKDYNGAVQLTYDITDGHGGTVQSSASMNLAATGDAALITGQDTGDVSESKYQDMSPDYAQSGMAKLGQNVLYVDGKLDISDPDSGESVFDTKRGGFDYSGQYGHLHMHEDGHWNYVVTAGSTDWVGNRQSSTGTTIDKLGAGQSLKDTITVYAKDGTAHDIVITIHGDNDKPYCSSEVQLAPGREDNQVTITEADLLQNTVDVDNNDQGKLTIDNLRVDHGSVQHNPDGTYTLTPEANYNGQVHFNYDVKDAHSGVTSTGAVIALAAVGDAATFSGDDTGGIIEDKNPTRGVQDPALLTYGHLAVSDADAGQSNFGFRGSSSSNDRFGGSLRISDHGNWRYEVANSAVQHLSEGQQVQVTHTVHSADGTAHDIVITITGTNDAPVLQGQSHSVTEDGSLLSGQMTATDADTGDTTSFSPGTQVAGFNMKSDGSYTFDPTDQAYQHLAAGQTEVVRIPVTVTDSAGATATQNLEITVTGTDDAAIISSSGVTVTEDLAPGSSWSNINVQDPDGGPGGNITAIEINGIIHNVPANFGSSFHASYGTFATTHGTDGHDKWRYTADNGDTAVQGLKSGESLTETMTLITADGTRIPVTATIQGTDDGVVIDTPDALTSPLAVVTEDSHASASGTLQAHDADTHDTVSFTPQTVTDALGAFTVDTQGQWSYTLDPKVSQGLSATDHFAKGFDITATSSDGSTATKHVEVFIQGTNDAPTVTGTTDLGATDQGQSVTITQAQLTAHVTDIDGDAVTVSAVSVDPKAGSISHNQDGTFTFTPAPGFSGNNIPVSFSVTDGKATTQGTATVDVHQQVNHAPVIDVGQFSTHTSGANLAGTMGATDVDKGDRQRWSVVTPTGSQGQSAHGQFGSFTINANSGAFIYAPDGAGSQVQKSGPMPPGGGHVVDSFVVAVTDSQGLSHEMQVNVEVNTNAHHVHGASGHWVAHIVPVGASLNAMVSHDEAITDPDMSVHEIDAELTAVSEEIHNLEAQGKDSTEAQAKFDALSDHKSDLENSQHPQEPTQQTSYEGGDTDTFSVTVDGDQLTVTHDSTEQPASMLEPESETGEVESGAATGVQSPASDLSGLISEEPTLNFDSLSSGTSSASDQHDLAPSSAGNGAHTSSSQDYTLDHSSTSDDHTDTHESDQKAEEKPADATPLVSTDILQDGGDGNIDPLLQGQPEKKPVPIKTDQDGAAEDKPDEAKTPEEEHAAVDTATLDSTLVDTPDDPSV